MKTHTKKIIQVHDLTIGYEDTTILENVSFSIAHGTIVVILGGSGSGKSTLLKHLIGLYTPWNGTIQIDGENIVTAEGEERVHILNKIGVMYQGGALFGNMTLRENVRLPLSEFTDLSEHIIDQLAVHKLQLVKLAGFEEFYPHEISGGMQKRAAIARALSMDPEIIFLDEPSAGLDPITSAELDQLVLQLSRDLKVTFVVVTHELESIFTIADRVLFIDKDQRAIIADGAPEELKNNKDHDVVYRFFNRII